jgi:hypothetical protein
MMMMIIIIIRGSPLAQEEKYQGRKKTRDNR